MRELHWLFTDLSLCSWTRAHFTVTESFLLCVSAVHTHHPEENKNKKNLQHRPLKSHHQPLLHLNTQRRVVWNMVNSFPTCHSWGWQHTAPGDPRWPPARSSCGHSRYTASDLNIKKKNIWNLCYIHKTSHFSLSSQLDLYNFEAHFPKGLNRTEGSVKVSMFYSLASAQFVLWFILLTVFMTNGFLRYVRFSFKRTPVTLCIISQRLLASWTFITRSFSSVYWIIRSINHFKDLVAGLSRKVDSLLVFFF